MINHIGAQGTQNEEFRSALAGGMAYKVDGPRPFDRLRPFGMSTLPRRDEDEAVNQAPEAASSQSPMTLRGQDC